MSVRYMKISALAVVAGQLLLLGCAGSRKTPGFSPITSNGEECLKKCNAEKALCMPAKDGVLSGSDGHKCEAAYSACLKPCVEFDAMIKKAM